MTPKSMLCPWVLLTGLAPLSLYFDILFGYLIDFMGTGLAPSLPHWCPYGATPQVGCAVGQTMHGYAALVALDVYKKS